MAEAVVWMRSLHILFAVLWGGAGLHYKFVSGPAAVASGAKADFLAHSRHGPYMGLTSLGTLAFGLATYLMVGPDTYGSAANAILGIGMLGAFVAFLSGWLGHLPVSMRIGRALEAGADTSALVARDDLFGRFSGGGLVVALLSMVLFRLF